AAVINFAPVQIFSAGPKTAHFDAQVVARRCSGLFGTLLCEHRGPGAGGARLDSIVRLDECQAVDLLVHSYDPSSGIPPENAVHIDADGARTVAAHGFVR